MLQEIWYLNCNICRWRWRTWASKWLLYSQQFSYPWQWLSYECSLKADSSWEKYYRCLYITNFFYLFLTIYCKRLHLELNFASLQKYYLTRLHACILLNWLAQNSSFTGRKTTLICNFLQTKLLIWKLYLSVKQSNKRSLELK